MVKIFGFNDTQALENRAGVVLSVRSIGLKRSVYEQFLLISIDIMIVSCENSRLSRRTAIRNALICPRATRQNCNSKEARLQSFCFLSDG